APEASITNSYVNALLNSTPPGLAEAEAVLATPSLKTNDSASLLMSRASLRKRQNRGEDAMSDAVSSLGLCGTDPNLIAQWYSTMTQVFKTTRERVQILNAVRPVPAAAPWIQHYMARVMLEDATNRTQAISALQQMAAES